MTIDSYEYEHQTPRPATSTVARAIVDALVARGVTAAFGIPGGLIGSIFDALEDTPKIKLVNTRHEGIAGFAAIGHALATKTPALVLTTAGPGITNALTGVAAAKEEHAPLLFIGGDVPANATSRAAIQDSSSNGIDSVALMRTVTKASFKVEHPEAALSTIEHALRIATTAPCGPVFISLPVDVSNMQVRGLSLSLPPPPAPMEPDSFAASELARELGNAKRPLIVAGNGARSAAGVLRQIAERLQCPVVTTPHSKGVFPDSHPLHLGGIGLGGHPTALAYLRAKPDVVCIVGSRAGDFATNGWTLSLEGSRSTFQIDHDTRLMGRNAKLTLGIVGDATRTLVRVLEELPQARPRSVAHTGRSFLLPETIDSDASPLTPARALRGIERAFPNATWITDQGEHCAYALHYLTVDRPDRFYSLVGLASMGSGLGAAIGLAHARAGNPVIAVIGDGSFAMHAGEMMTCVEHGTPIIFAIINDGRWNMVHHGFRSTFGRTVSSFPSRLADLAGVARDFGAIGVTLESPSELSPESLSPLQYLQRPVVLDIRIDPGRPLSTLSRIASIDRFAGKA